MRKILFDTNVILDIGLKREPFFSDMAELIREIENNNFLSFITASTITDIYYIAKREKGNKIALEFINDLVQFIDIIGVDKEIVLEALKSSISDFEDAIQAISAMFNDIEIIITRNVNDFKKSGLIVLTPREFLKRYIYN